ncbi:MAG TPA: GntR family transcriptional regulator [Clostridiaceae bacterium]|nr:GntR family transcriptional regulator [Clostridiaceae bacterium]
MSYEFSHEVPIYLQIMDIYRSEILAGRLIRGDQMPPVREVALAYGVNPNTVQKAFLEMDRLELTRSERTSGRFVVATDELIESLRLEQSDKKVQDFILDMKALRISRQETLDMVKKGWKDD